MGGFFAGSIFFTTFPDFNFTCVVALFLANATVVGEESESACAAAKFLTEAAFAAGFLAGTVFFVIFPCSVVVDEIATGFFVGNFDLRIICSLDLYCTVAGDTTIGEFTTGAVFVVVVVDEFLAGVDFFEHSARISAILIVVSSSSSTCSSS